MSCPGSCNVIYDATWMHKHTVYCRSIHAYSVFVQGFYSEDHILYNVIPLQFAFCFTDKDPWAPFHFFFFSFSSFFRSWGESKAMFNTEMEKLPLVSNLAEHAEEEWRVERSGAREEVEREKMREGSARRGD